MQGGISHELSVRLSVCQTRDKTKETSDDILIPYTDRKLFRFVTIHGFDRRTDGRTDR